MPNQRRDIGLTGITSLSFFRRVLTPRTVMAGVLATTLLLGAGCGGRGSKRPGLTLGNPKVAWTLKTREERMSFMAAQVHPRLEELFVEYDGQWAGTFACETCHGEDMELVDYKMPLSSLYALPEQGTIEEAKSYDEDVTEFMVSKVTPAMNKLLDKGSGPKANITCLSCHPKEEAE